MTNLGVLGGGRFIPPFLQFVKSNFPNFMLHADRHFSDITPSSIYYVNIYCLKCIQAY